MKRDPQILTLDEVRTARVVVDKWTDRNRPVREAIVGVSFFDALKDGAGMLQDDEAMIEAFDVNNSN